jgi:hypothetical protein
VDHRPLSSIYGPSTIESAEVQDMSANGAFDEAVQGAAGFIQR